MPLVTIKILEGRTLQQKRDMSRAVCDAICDTLQVGPEKVRIDIVNMANEDYSIGGQLIIDSK
jgi:4-oxalocrotonate tautomerase